MDTMIGGGRPLITFRKENVISLHTESFEIEYVYDSTRIYFKPALIIGGIFAFFVAVMTLSRISPSLEVPRGGGGEERCGYEEQRYGDGKTLKNWIQDDVSKRGYPTLPLRLSEMFARRR